MSSAMTQQRPTTARGAACTIAVEGNRLIVQWDAPDWPTWHEMFSDWKRMLGRHSDAVWREKARRWSLPCSSRQKLSEWLETWQGQGMTVTGSFDAPEQPGAKRGASELADLTLKRERMAADLKRLPQTGAIARCGRRSLATLDEEMAAVIAGRARDD